MKVQCSVGLVVIALLHSDILAQTSQLDFCHFSTSSRAAQLFQQRTA